MSFVAACAQFAPAKAEVQANLDRIAEIATQASKEGADLAVFSETAVSGYFLEGGVFESALSPEEVRAELDRRLVGLNRPLDILVGHYEKSDTGLYNAATYLEFADCRSSVVGSYRKFFLPTYGVFDEERYVARGNELGLIRSRLGTFGVLICEDAWHSVLPTICAVAGATALLVPSASPGRGFTGEMPDNLDRYRRLLRGVAEEHGVYCLNAMLCGFEGGKGFVGGSAIFDPFGSLIAEAPVLEDSLVLAEIDPEKVVLARAQQPLLNDLQSAWPDLLRIAEKL